MLDRNDATFLKCLLDWYLEQAEAQRAGANDNDEEEWAFSGFRRRGRDRMGAQATPHDADYRTGRAN